MKIIINERQERLLHALFLKEAALPEFSLEELSSIKSFANKVKYCKQYLGMSIGSGSSRTVFQIDDEKVLKLAKNAKGIAQNEYEYDNYYACNDDVLPRCFECADDYSWIISEYVLPATKNDFKVVFGMTWDEFCGWLNRTKLQYVHSSYRRYMWNVMDEDKWLDIIENNENIQPLYDWLTNYQHDMGDLHRIANWGLTIRDGEPTLVILDNGLSEEIFNQYYKRW